MFWAFAKSMDLDRRIRLGLKRCLARLGYFSAPQFLIVGAQKSGTTALSRYLCQHPSIKGSSKKEINFFAQEIAYRRGLAWYHSHFPLPHRLGRHGFTFENSPAYLYYPSSAERISSYAPDVKLIALLRDPVVRAFSAWNMFRNFALESFKLAPGSCDEPQRMALNKLLCADPFPTFDDAVRDEIQRLRLEESGLEPSFVRCGLYHQQFLRYFKFFKREQLLILDTRSLRDDTVQVLEQITGFLGLPAHHWSQQEQPPVLVGAYEDEISSQTHASLTEFYRPYNERLYELIGHDFRW